MEINEEVYRKVTDETGSEITENGNILLQRVSDEQFVYIPYGMYSSAVEGEPSETHESKFDQMESVIEKDNNRAPWSRDEILELINKYKKHENKFKGSIIRNDKVWQMVADDVKGHSAEQCKNKFKYLKQKYMAKKDNMKCSGAGLVQFPYFKPMDDIFGKCANVKPLSVASSSRGCGNLTGLKDADTTTENSNEHILRPTPTDSRKRPRSQLEKQLTTFHEHLNAKEEAKEVRHAERMRKQEQAFAILESIANSFKKIADKM